MSPIQSAMFLKSLTLEDSGKAALLHQNAFYKGWTEEDFLNFLKTPGIEGLKIEENHELMGYILFRWVESEAEILTLVIDPSCQRKGKGSLLLQELLDILIKKGVKDLYLEVAEDNIQAQSFYLDHGFILLSKRPHYYPREKNKFIAALNFYRKLL